MCLYNNLGYLHLVAILKDFKLLQILLELQRSRLKIRVYIQKLCIVALADV